MLSERMYNVYIYTRICNLPICYNDGKGNVSLESILSNFFPANTQFIYGRIEVEPKGTTK